MGVPTKYPPQWDVTSPPTVGWMRQFRYFTELYDRIRHIPGDIVECGVGKGMTLAMLCYLAGSEDGPVKGRRVWGFDSFEGWPEPTEWDRSPRNPQKGEWAIPEEQVRQWLEGSKIPQAFPHLDLRLVRGFVGESLPQFESVRPAFLHLDLDLYPGYRDALRHLFSRMALGGIVAFDEYREFPQTEQFGFGKIEKWPGCTRAVDEFFAGRPEVLTCHPETRKYFTVKVGD